MRALKKILSKIRNIGIVEAFYIVLKRIKYKKMLRANSIEERFNIIYRENHWSSEESISGDGSEIEYTHNLRKWLIKKIGELGIKKLVDAPCGDFNWMKLVVQEVDINYIGIDIVQDIITANNSLYKEANISFDVGNICEDTLPACDLLIVRDCLFHLSFEDIDKFLKNISNLEYKYLLTTNHILDKNYINVDIKSGDFRNINIYNKPFNFRNKDIIDRVDDFPENHTLTPREMILIEKQNVPPSISSFL